MAWTAAQVTTVETAIITLAGGAQEVEIEGKRFKKSSLPELMKLRDQMIAEIQNASDGGVVKVTFKDKASI